MAIKTNFKGKMILPAILPPNSNGNNRNCCRSVKSLLPFLTPRSSNILLSEDIGVDSSNSFVFSSVDVTSTRPIFTGNAAEKPWTISSPPSGVSARAIFSLRLCVQVSKVIVAYQSSMRNENTKPFVNETG